VTPSGIELVSHLCFKVKMSVMTIDSVLDKMLTVFLESCCEFSVDM